MRLRVLLPLLLAALAASAPIPTAAGKFVIEGATRIADPKLPQGGAHFALRLAAGTSSAQARMEVLRGATVIARPWRGAVSDAAVSLAAWDGRDDQGDRCSTGNYLVRFRAPGVAPADLPLDIVRLGVTEIEAHDSPAGDDEFPMVYFRKGDEYAHFATPQICEYANLAPRDEVSALDRDDGEARPVVPVHTATDAPALDGGGNYEAATYNYPLAYVMGAAPRLELTFGRQGTTAGGAPMPAGYPVPGFDLRAVVESGASLSATGPIAPGDRATVDLAPLPREVGRTDLVLELRWQAAPTGSGDWSDVPGRRVIPLRVYTLLGPPVWGGGESGTAYAGPWVEVAEHVASWKGALGMPSYDAETLTALFVQGFFGQNGRLTEALEGVVYDCYPMGGDGGATHYFRHNTVPQRMDLSRLLNGHADGKYVNCQDNMGAASTMLSMLGAPNVRPVRLGSMTLRAIWGVGTPAYTTDLWGSGIHGFSYHYVVTDDDGVTVSDTCLQVDEDGQPNKTPGHPGWNHHRKWKTANGYNQLSSYNSTSHALKTLPGVL